MTELSFPALLAARACRTSPSPTLAMPATPTCKKLRRLSPSQYRAVVPASTRNMGPPPANKLGGKGRGGLLVGESSIRYQPLGNKFELWLWMGRKWACDRVDRRLKP